MTAYYPPITYIVPEAEDGWLLKAILLRRMHVSRKLQSRLKLTEQGITLNGRRVYTSVPVQAGDVVAIRMEQEISDDILPQPIPFEILYEDEHLLVVNKEAGMIVHPTHGHYTGTLANGVVDYWRQKGESFRFRAVHRLDQETTACACDSQKSIRAPAYIRANDRKPRGQNVPRIGAWDPGPVGGRN